MKTSATSRHPLSHRATCLACLALALPALAQDEATPPAAPSVPEEVLTMAALKVSAEKEPGNFVLGSEEIALTQAIDLSQLLAHESMVAVGGGSAVSQKIYVRGFEDTLLNVTVDGAAQAGELYHHQGRVQIEPEFLKAIELDAGAGAATNGAGALTGALRLTTKDAFDMLGEDRKVGAFVKGAYAFNGEDSDKEVVSIYGKIDDKLGLLVAGVRQSSGHYRDGAGRLTRPTAFDHERGYAKLTGLTGDHRFTLGYEKLHDFGTYYERPHLTNYTGRFILSDHEMNRETVTYNHSFKPEGDVVDFKATLFYTGNDFQNHRTTTGALYGLGDFSSAGADLRNTSRLGSHNLTYGLDGRRDRVSATQQATPPAFWGSSRQEASQAGLYAQDRWSLLSALTATAGLRLDHYSHKGVSGVSAGIDNDATGFSPNAGLEWKALPGLTLRTSYARAFRGVTIREAFFSALYQHTENLDPEHADNLEFGVNYELNGFFARGTVFRQKIRNYIDAVYQGTTVWGIWDNIGDAKVKGYEVEIGHRWRDLTVAAGVWNSDNFLNGSALTDANLGLGTSVGRTWTARADYHLVKLGARLGLRARLVQDEANSITATAPDKEGYALLDLHSSWQPFKQTPLRFGVSATNLFDVSYYDQATYSYHSSGAKIGFPSKGREIVVSTSYSF